MLIQVNDTFRISSDRNCWTVQRYAGRRKDGEDEWQGLYYCADFRSALVALAELQIRLIDSSVPEEIRAALKTIKNECLTAVEMLKELPP